MIPLRSIAAGDRERVGGKALQLARLAEAGLPVPDAVVLPTGAFRDALASAGLLALAQRVVGDPGEAATLRERLIGLTLPPPLAAQVVAAARTLGGRLAVRSSAVDEDGASRSFAGQHATALGLFPEEVPAAVVRCWASLYEPRALAYRGARGPAPGALAVLIQRMVDPDCSGVMFTVDPLSGSWREMVVEAVWGLGEGLVSGQLAPHAWVVRRPRRLPRGIERVAARVRLQVVEEQVHELPERFVAGPAGVVREPVPADRRRRPTLERPAVRRLCRLGLRVERVLGEPQDVEWVRDRDGELFVLQARPITASGPPARSDVVLWTRRFVGERWPEPATPLGWSILRPLLEWFVAYPEVQDRFLGGGPALKLVHGRPYVNATVFRHLAFKLPGSPPPAFMLELVPPDEERAWRKRFAVAPDLAVYAAIFRSTFQERRWRRFRFNPFTNHLEWDRFQAKLEADLARFSPPPDTPEGLVARVNAHEDLVREYVGVHVCSLLFANLSWQLLDGALAGWLPERRADLLEGLATCPPGNLTVETNAALHALARTATDADLDALASGAPPSAAFAEGSGAFLARFGHRSEASWELMSPRWRRHPERLVPLLRAQRRVEAPDRRAELQEERHRAALAELRATLSGPRLTLTELLVHYTRRYLLLRENQRFWFDRLLASMQDTLLGLGAWAVAKGWLDAPEDVAFVTWPELQALVAGGLPPEGLRATVAKRRAEREADAALDPPTFLLGADVPEPAPDALRLQGLGISPGRARGRVRVLRTLADGQRLEPGEVLVTRAVDPAWTPLFLTAGAVVLELGSVLSHGAVVAREYRVPAVVNIDGAMRRLADGQEVTVDGTRGVVWVHVE